MAQVAIVGTEGVGKTVLMTMVAWAFKRDRDGVRMIPMSRQTSEHVARVWTVLNGGDWPPSTPQGQLLTLHWELHVDGAPVCDLRCLEIAGQDFRRLFADEEVNKLAELPEQLQRLAGFVEDADVIVFLANLRDFVGEADAQRADENQWALKFAMDWVRRQARPRRCCLIFTQSDQFGELKRQVGGWDKLAEKYLPYVYAAHVSSGAVPVMAVSAVGGTKVVVRDGRPLRVPDGKWLCKGLEKLAKWIGKSAHEVEQLALHTANQATGPVPPDGQGAPRPSPPVLPDIIRSASHRQRRMEMKRFAAPIIIGAVALCATAVIAILGIVSSARPVPEILSMTPSALPGPIDSWMNVKGRVRNAGAAGTIRVNAVAYEDGVLVDQKSVVYNLNRDQEVDFDIDLPGVYSVLDWQNRIKVEVTADVP